MFCHRYAVRAPKVYLQHPQLTLTARGAARKRRIAFDMAHPSRLLTPRRAQHSRGLFCLVVGKVFGTGHAGRGGLAKFQGVRSRHTTLCESYARAVRILSLSM